VIRSEKTEKIIDSSKIDEKRVRCIQWPREELKIGGCKELFALKCRKKSVKRTKKKFFSLGMKIFNYSERGCIPFHCRGR